MRECLLACGYVCHLCAGLIEARRGNWVPGTIVEDGCSCLLAPNTSPLKEQHVLLTTELSLLLHIFFFLNSL